MSNIGGEEQDADDLNVTIRQFILGQLFPFKLVETLINLNDVNYSTILLIHWNCQDY